MTTSSTTDDNHSGSRRRVSARIFRIGCWVPLIAFLFLMTFAAVAAGRVGHWPYYSHPDPKHLRLPLLHAAALFSYPLAFLGIPAGVLLLINARDSLPRRDIIVFVAGAALWTFILPIAGRLFSWLID